MRSAIAMAVLGGLVVAIAGRSLKAPEASSRGWKPVELSSSAVFVSMYELTPTQANGQDNYLMCFSMVDRAKETNAKAIQLVPTIHWKGTDVRVDSYCYRNAGYQCNEPTAAAVASFQQGLQRCMQYAVDSGFTTISMLPHLDNDASYQWRNKAWFDPLVAYAGHTYHEILVEPVARAMHAVAAGSKTPITMYLTLQGETGRSVIFAPRAWIQSFDLTKAIVTKGLDAERAKLMKVGISMNHNQICACIDFNNIRKADFANTYAVEINNVISNLNIQFDYAAIQALYKKIDFLGVSSYPALNPGDDTLDFEDPPKMNIFELSFFGVYMQQLIGQGKELIVSETGIGGADKFGGVEKNVTVIAQRPFDGIWAKATTSNNPWLLPANAEYRRQLYKDYLVYLAQGTGPQIRISHVFTWSGGSWDVLGTHYDSTTAETSYKDDQIIEWVAAHNAKVNSQS